MESYADQTQRNGAIIMELKSIHKCRDHPNEKNEGGICYKPEGCQLDEHVRLNNHRLKVWATAIVSDSKVSDDCSNFSIGSRRSNKAHTPKL